ncbi:hypothetical protein SAMN04488602_104175 [Paenibacillus sp. cl123]|nr:hypothetical protein SAMN04488602_104175 [Paenibacillus sp. cl123]
MWRTGVQQLTQKLRQTNGGARPLVVEGGIPK